MVICHDVTEQVESEKLAEDQKTYLQNALDIADLGTFKIELANATASYSENIRNWFGFTRLKVPLARIFSKIHPQDSLYLQEAINDSLQSEEKSSHDLTYRIISAKDGSIRHLRSVGKVLFTDGKPHSIIGTIQDVTPQILSRRRIEESEQQVRSLIESAPFPIGVYIGKEMRIQF